MYFLGRSDTYSEEPRAFCQEASVVSKAISATLIFTSYINIRLLFLPWGIQHVPSGAQAERCALCLWHWEWNSLEPIHWRHWLLTQDGDMGRTTQILQGTRSHRPQKTSAVLRNTRDDHITMLSLAPPQMAAANGPDQEHWDTKRYGIRTCVALIRCQGRQIIRATWPTCQSRVLHSHALDELSAHWPKQSRLLSLRVGEALL